MRVLHLDSVVWEPNKIAVARRPMNERAAMDRFAAEAPPDGSWRDGYPEAVPGGTASLLPELWFLDSPRSNALENCRNRPWEPDKYPSREAQDEKLPASCDWVKGYYNREGELSRRSHEALFESYTGRSNDSPNE